MNHRRSSDPITSYDRISEVPDTQPPVDLVMIIDAIEGQLPDEVARPEAVNHHQHEPWREGFDEYGNYSAEAHHNQWHIVVGEHPRHTDQAAVVVAEVTAPTGYAEHGLKDGELGGYEVRNLDLGGEVVSYFPRDTDPADIGWDVAQTYEDVQEVHQRVVEQQRVAMQQVHQQPGPGGPGL